MSGRFDVVVVGGRVAGAPTAMLLARRGLQVALVDRARLPSDTVSSHQLQVPAAAALHRWGLLDSALGGGGCATERVRLQVGDVSMTGRLPTVAGVSCILSPRRSRLDGLLLAEAVRAGVEVHTGFSLDEVLLDDGRVAGVRGRPRRGPSVTLRADLVVGADGKNSAVARAVGARVLRQRESSTLAQYAYWADLPTPQAELIHVTGRAAAAFPTDQGLTVTFAAVPADRLAAARRDPLEHLLGTLDACGDLGPRARAATLVERVRTTPDLPQVVRAAAGPGWALVGDAGLVMDPVSAQGIGNAFRSAEMLDRAVGRALAAGEPIDGRLGDYQRERDRAFADMFSLTSSLARLQPDRRTIVLARRVARRQREVDRLLAVFSGVEPVRRYFAPFNLARVLAGWGGADVAVR